MRLFRIGHTTFSVHPLFPLLLISYALGGQYQWLLAYLPALLLHECGHFYIAQRLHLPVSRIEITPFGGAMQIDLATHLPPLRGFLLSAGGVLVNLILALAVALLIWLSQGYLPLYSGLFLLVNLLMAALNLVPVLPLDGGRMLLSLLTRWLGHDLAFKLLLLLGRVLALLLLVYSFIRAHSGAYAPARILLSCYLLYASALEERSSHSRYLASFLSRRVKIGKSGTLPLQHLCASADLPLHALLPQLHAGSCHCVDIIDPHDASLLGSIYENDLLSAVLDTPLATLGELLAPPRLHK